MAHWRLSWTVTAAVSLTWPGRRLRRLTPRAFVTTGPSRLGQTRTRDGVSHRCSGRKGHFQRMPRRGGQKKGGQTSRGDSPRGTFADPHLTLIRFAPPPPTDSISLIKTLREVPPEFPPGDLLRDHKNWFAFRYVLPSPPSSAQHLESWAELGRLDSNALCLSAPI